MSKPKDTENNFLLANIDGSSNNKGQENVIYEINEVSEEYRGSNPSDYMNVNNESLGSKNSFYGVNGTNSVNRQVSSPQAKNDVNSSAKNFINPSVEHI